MGWLMLEFWDTWRAGLRRFRRDTACGHWARGAKIQSILCSQALCPGCTLSRQRNGCPCPSHTKASLFMLVAALYFKTGVKKPIIEDSPS